ncbi:hypothetical protein [Metabacillus fastidiosus]|uniref:hypothetical protein n=1 Tax=Metabacillus fastidiosus TaxID=1458 RepID=UPI003D2691DC
MKKYYIELPYTGVLKVEVNAESEEAALERIYETDREKIYNGEVDDIHWIESEEDYHKQIIQGNVFLGIQNEMHIEEVEDEDED